MELRLVRAFVGVARQGSAARAARVLRRSQPSISMALKALQEDLGVRLFERVGRRNRLTREGRALLETKGLPCRVALEAGGWEIVKRYVALGLGIAIVPAFCVEKKDGARLGRRSAAHLFGEHRYGIVVKHGRPLSPAAQELVRLIDPRFPAEPGTR